MIVMAVCRGVAWHGGAGQFKLRTTNMAGRTDMNGLYLSLVSRRRGHGLDKACGG
jgi:hypothetical protein